MTIARPIRTAFSPDPQTRQTTTPKVSEDERQEMNRVMGEKVRFRDERKKELMEKSFLPEEDAEQKANEEAFSDLPESWRPRNITPSERQRIKNQKTFTEENVKQRQLDQTKQGLKDQGTSKEDTKKQRGSDYKLSLGQMSGFEYQFEKEWHKTQKDLRAREKATLKKQWEKQDAQDDKAFEKKLKTLSKDQQGAAKRLRKAEIKKREQDRKLTLYIEEIKEYPEKERIVKIANFKKKLGMPESLGTEDAETASTGLGLVSKVTTLSGTLSNVSSDLTSDKSIGGTTQLGEVMLPTGSDEQVKFTPGGTANQGTDILSAASDLSALGGEISALVSSFKTKSKGNPAQQAVADDQIVDNVLNVGQTTESLGEDAAYLVEAFGNSTQALQGAGVIPIFDLLMNIQRLVQDAKHVIENATRTANQGILKNQAGKLGDEVSSLNLELSYGRGVHLAAHYSVDAVATGLKVVGDVVTLSGVGAAAGQATKLAGTAIGAANKAARTVADSYLAGRTLESRRGAQLAKPGSSEDLMRFDPKHTSQAFISRAREGDVLALKALATFGITKAILAKSEDVSLRQLILAKLELSEDPKTLSGSAGQGIQKVWKKVKGIGSSARNLHLKEQELKDLKYVKNALNYGGRSDRGVNWKSKTRLSTYDDLVAQKGRLAKAIVSSDLSDEVKDHLLYFTMTTREREKKIKENRQQKELDDIQVRAPRLKQANPKQPLDTMSQDQLEEVMLSELSDPDDRMLALNVWGDRLRENA